MFCTDVRSLGVLTVVPHILMMMGSGKIAGERETNKKWKCIREDSQRSGRDENESSEILFLEEIRWWLWCCIALYFLLKRNLVSPPDLKRQKMESLSRKSGDVITSSPQTQKRSILSEGRFWIGREAEESRMKQRLFLFSPSRFPSGGQKKNWIETWIQKGFLLLLLFTLRIVGERVELKGGKRTKKYHKKEREQIMEWKEWWRSCAPRVEGTSSSYERKEGKGRKTLSRVKQNEEKWFRQEWMMFRFLMVMMMVLLLIFGGGGERQNPKNPLLMLLWKPTADYYFC